jgi:syntaxin 1B/2/3
VWSANSESVCAPSTSVIFFYRKKSDLCFPPTVKPDATAEEVSAVVNDTSGQGSQIFAQALSSSTRYSESRMAYREAQERHEEILRIEQNIAELAQLMNDVGSMSDRRGV